MNVVRHSVLYLVILLLALCALPRTGASAAKETWTSIQSKNFFLVGNASERDIRKVAVQLEQFREVFTRLFNRVNLKALAPIKVIVFRDDAAYRPYKPVYQGQPAAVSGYFQSGEDLNYITLTAMWRNQNPYAVIFHELAHVYTLANARALPPWLGEGLAEYYSTFEVTDGDKKVWLGKAIAEHVRLLRERRFMPLAQLFSVNHSSAEYNERDKKTVFYAQAWALVHYLLLGNNGARQPQFRQFINALAQGQPVESSFKQAFQTDYATLEKELQDYIGRDTYPAQYVTFNEKLQFDTAMQTTPVSEAEAQFHLGDLLWRIKRPQEAEAHLQNALALDPKLAVANAALGMVKMHAKNFAEARQYLQKAVAEDSQNYLVHYYYAYVLSREAMGEARIVSALPDESAQEMRKALRRTLELAPNFAEAYRLLSFINLVKNENLDESVALLKQAMGLLPGNHDFPLLLGQIYLRQEKYDLVKQTLEPLTRDGVDPHWRTQAQSYLDIVKRVEALSSLRLPQEGGVAVESEKHTFIETPVPPRPALRQRFEGEELKGWLTRVDCTNQGVTLTVKTDTGSVQLFTATPEKLVFMTYTQEMGQSFTCGVINPPKQIVVTYRKAGEAKAKYLGEPVAVQFVSGKEQ
jgi:tetratricopeptide (TPR) repeat protein